jgi:hypothetical protein
VRKNNVERGASENCCSIGLSFTLSLSPACWFAALLLYLLLYCSNKDIFWGGRRGLNPQPLEPQSSALPLSYAHRSYMARLKGFEPLAHCLEGSCSIQLSYRRMVGARGFEPPTPCAQGRCASQAALRPVNI